MAQRADQPSLQRQPNIGNVLTALSPTVRGDRLELRWKSGSKKTSSLLSIFTRPLAQARTAQRRAEALNDLKHMALAMHNHYDVNRKFPAAASRDANGKKLLSWRVHVLPYLGQVELYESFRLDEPWDSPHNTALLQNMPADDA